MLLNFWYFMLQDTVVALQALSRYNIKSYSPDVDLEIDLLAKNWNAVQLKLTRENSGLQLIAEKVCFCSVYAQQCSFPISSF